MNNMFSSFLMGGYECNGALAKHKRFNDLKDTKHHIYCRHDYQLLKDIGIFTVREGLLWHEIDQGKGIYDFAIFEAMMQIAQEEGIQQIWDLNHFDFPPYLDPFSDHFVEAFAKYAVECVKLIRKYQTGTLFIVPFNEISFFTYMGGELGAWAPFQKNRGDELKRQCVKAVISSINEIRRVEADIRFINVDPLMIRKPFAKNVITESMEYTFESITFETFDMIAGLKHPELGGSFQHLDIVGINHYPTSQEWLHYDQDFKVVSQERMDWHDQGWTPLVQILTKVVSMYERPLVLSETGAWGNLREDWWQEIVKQVEEILALGLDLRGVCAYPVIDRADWSEGHLTNSGFWDFEFGDKELLRKPYEPVLKLIKDFTSKGSKQSVSTQTTILTS